MVNSSVRQCCFPAHCGYIQEIYGKSFQAISQSLTMGTRAMPKHRSVPDLQGLVTGVAASHFLWYLENNGTSFPPEHVLNVLLLNNLVQKDSDSFISKQSFRRINN